MHSWINTAAAAALTLVAFASAANAADPTPEELKQQFQETLAASRLALTWKGDRLTGPGADFLKSRGADSQFVLVGEEHGVATIAQTVRAYFADLNAAGYRHFAIEVDPYMTSTLEDLLRTGGTKAVASYLKQDGNQLSLPFYSWKTEAELANAVVRANPNTASVLWGLDQTFIGATYPLLVDIAKQTASAEAKALASKLAAQAKGNLEYLGKADLAELQKLRDAVETPLKQRVDDMILSARIYAPFTGGVGLSVYAANLERENLMKRTFLARYRDAAQREGAAPHVLFKFGGNHMMRGLSQTNVPSLGQFVADFAQSEGRTAFNLLVLCGPNTKAGDFMGNEATCDMEFEKAFAELAPHVDKKNPTLFDLRPWKDKPRRWAHLSAEVKQMIWAYDAFLFVPNGTPARSL